MTAPRDAARSSPDRLIYHLYADEGVESEVLSGYGRVVRVGLDPKDTNSSEPLAADARDPPLGETADLVFLQPECYLWSDATRHKRGEGEIEYENQIEDARRVGQELGDHYIIENNPDAPLREPVTLNGRMFRLPIVMERSFETSFPVPQPQNENPDPDETNWWNEYSRPYDYWKSVNGYSNEYRKDPLVKAAIPRAYMDFLLRYWIAAVEGVDVRENEPLSRYA